MEIQSLNNNTINNINVDSLQQASKAKETSEIGINDKSAIQNTVDVNNDTQRSNLANDINGQIKTLSLASQSTAVVKDQIQTMTNMQDKIALVKSDGTQSNNMQQEIAQTIDGFNAQANKVNELLNTISDFDGESTSTFSNEAGAIPLNVDMLTDNIAQKNTELTNTLDKLQDVQEVAIKTAKDNISEESSKSQEQSPFKDMDFGQQSADFGNTTLSSVAGSIASSQANSMQSIVMRLVS
jgi:hypothetical protein